MPLGWRHRRGRPAGASAQAPGLATRAIDAIVVSTCTGYLCPGLSGYVIEALDLRSDVQAFDLVGQGCAAAVPNLVLGRALLESGACDQVLSICVEVSSAAMFLDDDPGVIISACLFGDGAGAAVLSRDAPTARRTIKWKDNASLINPAYREALRFETRGGMLRNILTRSVPGLAADHARQVLTTGGASRQSRARARRDQHLDHSRGRARRAERHGKEPGIGSDEPSLQRLDAARIPEIYPALSSTSCSTRR